MRKLDPSQNSHLAATRFPGTSHKVAGGSTAPLNSNSTPRQRSRKHLVRRGYWNRRGDHLTPEGYIVFPPLSFQYPEELSTSPFENQGYQDHTGLFIAYARHPELPQSLSKHGNPSERPYESFVVYV